MKISSASMATAGLALGLFVPLQAGANEGNARYTTLPDQPNPPRVRNNFFIPSPFAADRIKALAQGLLAERRGGATSAAAGSATGARSMYALGALKWNHGAHSTMAYAISALPAGAYRVGRPANFGLNHWSLDLGGGYSYLEPRRGRELSALGGFTYNFENDDSDYKTGVDSHLDWAASQFVSRQTHVGVAGYFYYQLTGNSGAGARFGDYKSRVAGLGPQLGHFFNVNGRKWYVNVKGFYDFNAKNRPEGWNLWLTLAIPL